MKKTRKVLSIVTVVVLVLYFSSMAVLYGNMKDTVKANIYDEASTLAEEFNNNSYENLEHFVSVTNQSLPMYPTKYYVYDETGENLLAQTSNQIMFQYGPLLKYGIVNLDEYLSEKQIEQLAQMDNKYSSNYSTFKYAIDGDKVIPCSLVYRILPDGTDGESFTFTNTKPTGEISCISNILKWICIRHIRLIFKKKIMILSTRNSKTARCLKPNVKKISQTRGEVQ